MGTALLARPEQEIAIAQGRDSGSGNEDWEVIDPTEHGNLQALACALSDGMDVSESEVVEAARNAWLDECGDVLQGCSWAWIKRQVAEVYALAASYWHFEFEMCRENFGDEEVDRHVGLVSVAIRMLIPLAQQRKDGRDHLRLAELLVLRSDLHDFSNDLENAVRDVEMALLLAHAVGSRGSTEATRLLGAEIVHRDLLLTRVKDKYGLVSGERAATA